MVVNLSHYYYVNHLAKREPMKRIELYVQDSYGMYFHLDPTVFEDRSDIKYRYKEYMKNYLRVTTVAS